MGYPRIDSFPLSHPGPYELEMGTVVVSLLNLFRGLAPDPESWRHVLELAERPDRWSAAHKVFDEIRRRYLEERDPIRKCQYSFEESCVKAFYIASAPDDPFDSSSPFFVAGGAILLARRLGISAESITKVLAPLE